MQKKNYEAHFAYSTVTIQIWRQSSTNFSFFEKFHIMRKMISTSSNVRNLWKFKQVRRDRWCNDLCNGRWWVWRDLWSTMEFTQVQASEWPRRDCPTWKVRGNSFYTITVCQLTPPKVEHLQAHNNRTRHTRYPCSHWLLIIAKMAVRLVR